MCPGLYGYSEPKSCDCFANNKIKTTHIRYILMHATRYAVSCESKNDCYYTSAAQMEKRE